MLNDAERALRLVHALLHQAPPEGITPSEVDAWCKRNRPALLQVLEQALSVPVPSPPPPPPLVPVTMAPARELYTL